MLSSRAYMPLCQTGMRRSAFGHGPGHHMAGGSSTPASTLVLCSGSPVNNACYNYWRVSAC
eukprot:3869988-Amphidinium_carterae.1